MLTSRADFNSVITTNIVIFEDDQNEGVDIVNDRSGLRWNLERPKRFKN